METHRPCRRTTRGARGVAEPKVTLERGENWLRHLKGWVSYRSSFAWQSTPGELLQGQLNIGVTIRGIADLEVLTIQAALSGEACQSSLQPKK